MPYYESASRDTATGGRENNKIGRCTCMNINEILSPALWGVLGSAITGIITYKSTANKTKGETKIEQMEYVDKQIQTLLDAYQKETAILKNQIQNLTEKNQELVDEILVLRCKIIELEGVATVERYIRDETSEDNLLQ